MIGSAQQLSRKDLEARLEAAAAHVQQAPDAALSELLAVRDEATRCELRDIAGHCSYLTARAHVNLGNLESALGCINEAHADFSAAGLLVDAARTGLGRMNVLDDLGRHHEAIEVGRAMLDDLGHVEAGFGEGAGTERLAAAAHENIGVSNGILGRHDEALVAYEEAERRYGEAGLEGDSARCCANRGVELVEMGRSAEAIEALQRSAPGFLAEGDSLFAGLCAAYEAKAHVQRGDFRSAHDLLATSDELLSALDATTEWARAQLVRAETLEALNLLDDAAALYEMLEQRFTESGLRHDSAHATLGRARIALRIASKSAAGTLFERARSESVELGDEAMRAATCLGLSYCGDAETSVSEASAAVAIFQRLGRHGDEVAARLRLIELDADPDGDHLRRCAEVLAATPLPHLQWQVHRARALLERRAGDDDAALDQLTSASEVVEGLRNTVVDERSRLPFMGSRRDLHEDLVRLHLDNGDLRQAFDAIAAARSRTLLERREGRTLAEGNVGTTTVVYELLGSEVVALTRRGDELSVVRGLSDVSTLDRLLRRLGAQWRRFDPDVADASPSDALLASTLDVLQQLHDVLIGPLPGIADTGPLVVVPVAMLANVPFAALYDGERHLIDRRAVAIAASIDGMACARRGGASRLLVGVADDAAPRVVDEIEMIAGTARDPNGRDTILLGEAAVAERLTDLAGDHDVIHIACHGVNRPDNPALSSIELADRDVTAAELTELSLDGQLVALSACSSGRQHVAGNVDELLGLPRALVAAGAHAVVVNLWRVDDESACELMSDFHVRLATADPVHALRAAQLAIRRSRPHPYHWAPTVVYVGGASYFEHETRETS